MSTWYKVVCDELDAIERQEVADRKVFAALCDFLDDTKTRADSGPLTRDGDTAIRMHKGTSVFAFRVVGGKVRIEVPTRTPEIVDSKPAALMRMARLMAEALREETRQQGS